MSIKNSSSSPTAPNTINGGIAEEGVKPNPALSVASLRYDQPGP